MKTLKSFAFALLVLSVMTYSCSSDSNSEGGSPNEELANQQNETEETPIASSALSSGMAVEGATKTDGAPPAPNSNLNLSLDSSTAEAQQKSGFNLKFSSTEADVAGAYLQFKDVDGNAASNYFDIPASNFTTFKKANIKENQSSKSTFSKGSSLEDGEFEIDVDFGDDIPAGKFCADLCIYDSQNNISQIVTICVEVEAWGGNASLVGEWEIIENTSDDEMFPVNCSNGQSTQAYWEQEISEVTSLVISADGNFSYTEESDYYALDFFATSETCTATYETEASKDHYRETGKWSFNEDNSTLTLVMFTYEDFVIPAESYTEPNGELLLEAATIAFVNGDLVVTQIFSEGGQTFSEVITLRRK